MGDGWYAWIDVVLMMLAPALRYGRAALQSQNIAYTLVLNVSSNCSVVMSVSSDASCCLPATLTSRSRPPNCSTAVSTSSTQYCSSFTSPGTATALRPAFSIRLTTSCASASSCGRYDSTT